eukprot:5263585-Pyramimonas_sp.AAC.1
MQNTFFCRRLQGNGHGAEAASGSRCGANLTMQDTRCGKTWTVRGRPTRTSHRSATGTAAMDS